MNLTQELPPSAANPGATWLDKITPSEVFNSVIVKPLFVAVLMDLGGEIFRKTTCEQKPLGTCQSRAWWLCLSSAVGRHVFLSQVPHLRGYCARRHCSMKFVFAQL